MRCYKCGSEIPDNSLVCQSCGAEMSVYGRSSFEGKVNPESSKPYLSMKWFRFLIYFMLFADAIICVSNAVSYITGDIYAIQSAGEITAAQIYLEYGIALRCADMIYAATLVIFAVLAILTRYSLAKFKKNGPVLFYISYILNAAFGIGYMIAVSIISNADASGMSIVILQTAWQATYVYLNYLYFKKRRHLFEN